MGRSLIRTKMWQSISRKLNDKIWTVYTRMKMACGCHTLTFAKYSIKFMHLTEAFYQS